MKKRITLWWAKILGIFAVIGPGIIAANADNDAGGITTYSVVGAQFGFKMLWVLFLLTFALAITQEMGARIGLVTRQGLGGVIRENFGVRLTVVAMLAMLVANIGTTTAEFAGDIDPLFETAPLNDIDDWYIERMFHHGLVGIDAFLNWTASTLDTAIKNAHSGSLAEYDRGFATMQQGLDELNGLIGFSDRSPLTMRQIDFQDGFALSGLEVHGTRVYRFTPNPEVPHEVRTVGDGIELYSNGTLVKKIPHSTSIQNHKGYWIIQTGTDSLFTHGIDEMLQLL
jgi:hypothetical protein